MPMGEIVLVDSTMLKSNGIIWMGMFRMAHWCWRPPFLRRYTPVSDPVLLDSLAVFTPCLQTAKETKSRPDCFAGQQQ